MTTEGDAKQNFMEKINFKSKLEAVKDLSEFNHALLTPEYCEAIGEVFGFKPVLEKCYDNRSVFKGLYLSGINPKTGKEFQEGDYIMGLGDAELSAQLRTHLGLGSSEMMGRGSWHSDNCEVIIKSLSK